MSHSWGSDTVGYGLDNAASSTIPTLQPITVAQHDFIFAWLNADGAGVNFTVADNFSNTYVQVGASMTMAGPCSAALFVCRDSAGAGVCSPTASIVGGGTPINKKMVLGCVHGLSTSATILSTAGTSGVAVPTGTDTLYDTLLSTGSVPGIAIGFQWNAYNDILTPGTGWTAVPGGALAFGGYGAGITNAIQYKDGPLANVTSTFSCAASNGGSAALITIFIPEAAAAAPRKRGFATWLLPMMKSIAALPPFSFIDVGTAGWTIPVPTVSSGTRNAADTGSRIFFVDPVAGNDSTGAPYWWNGTNIIDGAGSTTGVGAVVYGTDPLNPTGPILPFQSYAHVAPRDGSSDYGTYTGERIGWCAMTANVRLGKPDWWLFKRGTTLDLYSDLRNWLDARGGAAQTTTHHGTVLRTAGGSGVGAGRAVLAAYGDPALGRARFVHPVIAFFGDLNDSATGHQHVTGLMADQITRDPAIRPVDYADYATANSGLSGALFLGMATNSTDMLFEDNHFYGCLGNVGFTWSSLHTTPIPGLTFHRNIITDAWDDNNNSRLVASRATTDQTFAANTTTTIVWNSVAGDTYSAFSSSTGIFTTPVAPGATWWSLWALVDVTANVPTNGSIELVLFVNGVEKASKLVAGIGGGVQTYKLHADLATGNLTIPTGQTLDIRIRTTSASGTVTVLGAAGVTSRLVIRELSKAGNPNGMWIGADRAIGARFNVQQNIFIRNGMTNNPTLQTSFYPDVAANTNGLYDWNIRNHNIYYDGDPDRTNCFFQDNVSLAGAAGIVMRVPINIQKNFLFEGYFGVQPYHPTRIYTTLAGDFTDNVLQNYVSAFGTNGNPGAGVTLSNGLYGAAVQRNIISHVPYTSPYSSLMLACVQNADWSPGAYYWQNDLTNVAITGNIVDSLSTDPLSQAFQEINGTTDLLVQWHTPITGVIGAGNTLTCTPDAAATGTPTYQWYRYTAGTGTKVLVPGATGPTYVLGAINVDWVTQGGVNYHLMACLVSGLTFPANAGIKGCSYTGNTTIYPSVSKAVSSYRVLDLTVTPGAPAASSSTITNAVHYDSIALAAAALLWPNPLASLATYLSSLGIFVSTSDGIKEYYDNAVGPNPQLTAMRRGFNWDIRLASGATVGNHIRAGRAMATVSVP